MYSDFDYNHDVKMFHSRFVYGLSAVQFPDYIEPFSGFRLRKSHLDYKCYTCNITPSNVDACRNLK